MKVMVIHGPNLNLLGTRELSVYGTDTLDEVNKKVTAAAKQLALEVVFHQTAREGEIIELLHSSVGTFDGVVLNPAAYAHTSRAIADAIRSIPSPVIEVHLSNIHAREPWRHVSVTGEAAIGMIAGFGAQSYVLALHALQDKIGS